MSKPLVWITGARGLIGSHLVQTATAFAPQWRVAALTRDQLELTDFSAVQNAFHAQQPSAIIHCAALSRSGACQADPELARRTNVSVTRCVGELAERIPFLFFSTDLVFDGRKGNYAEEDPVNPLTVYAETKVETEQLVLRNPGHSVVRVSINTGRSPTGDRSFTEEMRIRWERGETLRLFTDEFRCPIPATITARAVWELLRGGHAGLFHLAGSERLSRWEIGRVLASRWKNLNAAMDAASAKDFPGPPRSLDTSLDCSKIQHHLSFQLPRLTEWLRENPEAAI
jgi:dTDP-4-dehydrorhamnose reductase